jgi:hypothetical protein
MFIMYTSESWRDWSSVPDGGAAIADTPENATAKSAAQHILIVLCITDIGE